MNSNAPSPQPVPSLPEDFVVEGEAQIESELPTAAAPQNKQARNKTVKQS